MIIFPAYGTGVIHHDQRRIFHAIHLWWGLPQSSLSSPRFCFLLWLKIHLINRRGGLKLWDQNTQELFSLCCSFSLLWIISADRWPVQPSVSLLHKPVVGPLSSALELNEGFFDKRMIKANKCYWIIRHSLLLCFLLRNVKIIFSFFDWNARFLKGSGTYISLK